MLTKEKSETVQALCGIIKDICSLESRVLISRNEKVTFASYLRERGEDGKKSIIVTIEYK